MVVGFSGGKVAGRGLPDVGLCSLEQCLDLGA